MTANKSNDRWTLTGWIFVIVGLAVFTFLPVFESYQLTEESLAAENDYHATAILDAAKETMLGQTYANSFAFCKALEDVLEKASQSLANSAEIDGIPEGVNEWDYKLGDWKFTDYLFYTTKHSAYGPVAAHPLIFLLLSIGLTVLGGLVLAWQTFRNINDIKHHSIYHNSLTRGISFKPRTLILILTILGILTFGYFYMDRSWSWPMISLGIALVLMILVYSSNSRNQITSNRSASPSFTGYAALGLGIYLIGFYVLLYWNPQHITTWVGITDPISRMISGNEASQWFLYGLLYTLAVFVMGLRMIAKYSHHRYQILRTLSVMFFQTGFAFLIPEILVRFNYPYYDFKNIWPLNYSFFFDWNINSLISSGNLGIFMLVWGIILIVFAVPVITYFYGKRWYCSWVCGCGGLAETLGDPFRQLSDKSLNAWKYERWIIHGVLVAAVFMTAAVLYTYFSGSSKFLFTDSYKVREWYGFFIGSAFAGVVGTGFYPIMGNRVWCRFGCPLAAYLGLVQRFKSRFRITTNGAQCISCGNCSTYCEMGIDVRWYAQRGQDIVRSSCVGCGVCAAVCPRGVLRLENGPDTEGRAKELRVLQISEEEVSLNL